jgi:IclR family acetate operon transcriptional repressor
MQLATQDDRAGIQAISRAAAVLRALGRQQRAMSLGEIAITTGLPRSTVQRLVNALQQERLVEVGGSAGPGVRLGPALAELAGAIRVDIVRLARPHLQTLFDTVGETVDISQARGTEVQFLDQIITDQELRVVPRKDVSQPLHTMANGKALLAAMPDAAVERLLGPTLERPTARSIASLPALLVELAEIRRSGLAFDRQEHSEGVCAVGVGIHPGHGRHYAVSVAAPEQRFAAVLPAIPAALISCKLAIEASVRAALPTTPPLL